MRSHPAHRLLCRISWSWAISCKAQWNDVWKFWLLCDSRVNFLMTKADILLALWREPGSEFASRCSRCSLCFFSGSTKLKHTHYFRLKTTLGTECLFDLVESLKSLMFILWLRKLARLFCIGFLFLFLSDIGRGILKKGENCSCPWKAPRVKLLVQIGSHSKNGLEKC